jgi:Fur family transcriptional regulator, ferric uptake regulator
MAIAGTQAAVRSTRQRTAVTALLDGLEEFRTAQEIHDLLRRQGERIGLTTVYRSLQILAAGGQVDALRGPDGEICYRRCSTGHHHHLVCRRCGKTVEIDLPSIEKTTARVAHDHGFTDVDHTVEIFGTCADCATRP